VGVDAPANVLPFFGTAGCRTPVFAISLVLSGKTPDVVVVGLVGVCWGNRNVLPRSGDGNGAGAVVGVVQLDAIVEVGFVDVDGCPS